VTFVSRGACSIGEAASQIANDSSAIGHADYFKLFYQGFSSAVFSWFLYADSKNHFTHPIKFNLIEVTDEYTEKSLSVALRPGYLPVDFTSIKGKMSFEFYHPAVAARQMGFGQVPAHLRLFDKVKCREIINSGLEYSRLRDTTPSTETLDLDG
jgi:hypothetical protein